MDKYKIRCVSCNRDTNGFCMRGIFMICEKCISDSIDDPSIVINYSKSIDDYIEREGILNITQKLYDIFDESDNLIDHVLSSDDMFKDAIFRIYQRPYSDIKREDLLPILRDLKINSIIKN